MKFLRNLTRFVWSTLLWSVLGIIGCLFLALEAHACELSANAFLKGNILVPMSRPLAIFFGVSIDAMGIACVIAFYFFGVWWMKKVCEAYKREFPAPNILSEFF